MTTLVTGSTGLLGNNVVRLLLARGERVRVLVRRGCDSRPLAGLDVESCFGDVREPDVVREACRGVQAVVHSAALVHIGWTGLDEQQAVNVEGARNVALAARDAGAKLVHVLTIDTLGVGTRDQPADEDSPQVETVPCPYVVTKRAGERAILELVEQGLWATIVNPGFMLGPWDWKPSSGRMLLEVSRGWALIAPPGANTFCDARDVAAGILAAAERGQPGRRYILGGPAHSYMDAWRTFAEVTGGRRPWLTPPGPIALYVAGRFGDLRTRLFGREPDVNSASIALAKRPRFYSSARAERELGYRPRGLKESASDAWAWFREYKYA